MKNNKPCKVSMISFNNLKNNMIMKLMNYKNNMKLKKIFIKMQKLNTKIIKCSMNKI